MKTRWLIILLIAGTVLAVWLAKLHPRPGVASILATNSQQQGVSSTPTITLSHKRSAALPPPAAGDWRLAAIDKEKLLASRENKLAGLMYLPNVIKNLMEKNPEEVPPILETLISLVGDSDVEVSIKAALALYSLGDYDGIGIKRMQELLNQSWQFQNANDADGYTQFKLTVDVLAALQSANDHRLDGLIFDIWQKQNNTEPHLRQIDYAAFLERAGRELPEDYWAQRAKSQADSFALDLLKSRYDSKYQPLFQELFDKGNSWAAATLYQQTGDQKYADLLINQVSKAIGTSPNTDVTALAGPLEELSKAEPEKARELVAPVLLDKNDYAVEIALNGLKNDQSAEAAELIYGAATNRFAATNGELPLQLLDALAARPSPTAQARYEDVRNSILGKPQPAWHNAGAVYTASDFERFEQLRPANR